jgi:hypothetical protein
MTLHTQNRPRRHRHVRSPQVPRPARAQVQEVKRGRGAPTGRLGNAESVLKLCSPPSLLARTVYRDSYSRLALRMKMIQDV